MSLNRYFYTAKNCKTASPFCFQQQKCADLLFFVNNLTVKGIVFAERKKQKESKKRSERSKGKNLAMSIYFWGNNHKKISG